MSSLKHVHRKRNDKEMTQLFELSRPFQAPHVKPPAQGKHGDYVPHHIVVQRALSVVGPHSFNVTEAIRGLAPPVGKNKDGSYKYHQRDNAVLGCLATLTVTIDGTMVSVTEVGTEDQPAMGTDAENLKNAASDAYKRCWMRLGLGLHLWSGADYFLDKQLEKDAKE